MRVSTASYREQYNEEKLRLNINDVKVVSVAANALQRKHRVSNSQHLGSRYTFISLPTDMERIII